MNPKAIIHSRGAQRAVGSCLLVALLVLPGSARAQSAPAEAGSKAPAEAQFGTRSAGPETMDYEDGKPVPAGYHVASQKRRGLLIAGASAFGFFYALSLVAAAVDESSRPMFLPIAGPFITIGTAGANGGGAAALVLDGLAQTAGAAMFITAMATETQILKRDDVGRRVLVVPVVGPGRAGIGLVGAF